MPLWLARAAPATGPSPGMMLRTPGGTPASSASSPTRSALSGVCSATWQVTAHAGTCQSRRNIPKGYTHWPQHTLAHGTCFQRTSPKRTCRLWRPQAMTESKSKLSGGFTFMTMVLPVASAGPSFQACIRMGTFQGMICPTTPAHKTTNHICRFRMRQGRCCTPSIFWTDSSCAPSST